MYLGSEGSNTKRETEESNQVENYIHLKVLFCNVRLTGECALQLLNNVHFKPVIMHCAKIWAINKNSEFEIQLIEPTSLSHTSSLTNRVLLMSDLDNGNL
jgi:hypothetical protein